MLLVSGNVGHLLGFRLNECILKMKIANNKMLSDQIDFGVNANNRLCCSLRIMHDAGFLKITE